MGTKIHDLFNSSISSGILYNHNCGVLASPRLADGPALQNNASLRQKALLPLDEVEMRLPVAIEDYTYFFSSKHQAKNCRCSCILEFDGAAKGNLGPAGAGVVLGAVDGSHVENPHKI
nr:fumarylacetoacetase [Tanacetum cinerariifolium]